MKSVSRNISIVTAFFDIGRGEIDTAVYPSYLKRTNENYFEYFKNLASLENEMIVFTSAEFKGRILEIRKGRPTKVVVMNLEKKFRRQLLRIKEIQEDEEFRAKVNKDMLINIEYWSPEYVLINNLKAFFVNYAVNRNLVSSEMAAWIDFGYVREPETLNSIRKWDYPFEMDRMHFFTIRRNCRLKKVEDVHDAIFNNRVFIIGGSIVEKKENWKKFYRLLRKYQNEFLNSGIVDDDQGLFMMCLFRNRKMFKLNYLGKDRWFFLFKKYGKKTAFRNFFNKK